MISEDREITVTGTPRPRESAKGGQVWEGPCPQDQHPDSMEKVHLHTTRWWRNYIVRADP